jgi:hypothetical protein
MPWAGLIFFDLSHLLVLGWQYPGLLGRHIATDNFTKNYLDECFVSPKCQQDRRAVDRNIFGAQRDWSWKSVSGMGGRSISFWLWDFAAAGGKAMHSKNWLVHCILTGVGVRYRSIGKSKRKSRLKRFECNGPGGKP